MKSNKYAKRLTIKFVKKLIIISLIYTISFFAIYLFLYNLAQNVTWYPGDILYVILTSIAYNQSFMFFLWLIGIIIIFIILLMKSLSYIDKIIDASEIMVKNDATKVRLPEDLKDIEEKMNRLKKESQDNLQLAKENEQKKNDLIVYLAHDIKTPLTSVIGYLSILNDDKTLNAKQKKKYIDVALNKSYKLESLINELFEITKYNSQTIKINKSTINLTMLLEQVIDEFYPTTKSQNKQIVFNYNQEINIQGDSNQLARAFNNIIKNAVNYSYPNTNIIINIKEEIASIITTITNEGDTIKEQDLAKIFDKFYRTDASRNTKKGGSGLGLAIAKEIINLHKGTITVKSIKNKTEFIISLPKD